MKNSRLSEIRIRPKIRRPVPRPETFVPLLFLLLLPLSSSYGQFEQLIQEAQEFRENSRTLAQEVLRIIRIIAGVSFALTGLTWIYIRNQQNDLTEKLGKTVIGVAIFFAVVAIGEQIANL